MIPNATIIGWSTTGGAAPAGGSLLVAVTWPAGRLVPCQVSDFDAVKVATLQAADLDLTRTLRVRAAALRAMGITAQRDDRVTVANLRGAEPVVYVVRSVRGPQSGGRLGAVDEVVLTLGGAA